MRSLTPSERRLLLIVGVLAFLVVNALGYQWLARKRVIAKAAQSSANAEISRLKQLQMEKPEIEKTRDWLNARLPAYKDADQFENHLYQLVLDRARAADVELTKKDPKPTQTNDPDVHKSVVDLEFTTDIESIVRFLHSLQDREAFRFVSYLELTPTKGDDEKLRCVVKVEQWWRPDSLDVLAATDGVPDAATLPVAPGEPASVPDPAAPAGASVEQPAPSVVKTPETAVAPAPPTN